MPIRLIALAPAIAMLLGAGSPAWGDPQNPSDPGETPASSPTPASPPPTPAPTPTLTSAELLNKARDDFRFAKYKDAALALWAVLYPTAKLARPSELVEAYVMLGLCEFELGNKQAAQEQFEQALTMRLGQLELDSPEWNPKAVKFFNELKRIYLKRREELEQARVEAEAEKRAQEILDNIIVLERKPYFINFVPFGAGQFQNDHNRKGIIFFASETLLGGTSLALWGWQVGKYGFTGTVPREDAATVRRVQQFQIGTGVACLILMGLGIVDSLMHYESETRRPADKSLLRKHLKPKQRGTPKQTSLKVLPMADPDRVGITMGWEF